MCDLNFKMGFSWIIGLWTYVKSAIGNPLVGPQCFRFHYVQFIVNESQEIKRLQRKVQKKNSKDKPMKFR